MGLLKRVNHLTQIFQAPHQGSGSRTDNLADLILRLFNWLQHYIDFLDDATIEKIKDYPVLDKLIDNINNAPYIKELWDKVSIKVVSDKIDELNIANKEDKTFTTCKDDIECYIKMKEERYQKF